MIFEVRVNGLHSLTPSQVKRLEALLKDLLTHKLTEWWFEEEKKRLRKEHVRGKGSKRPRGLLQK